VFHDPVSLADDRGDPHGGQMCAELASRASVVRPRTARDVGADVQRSQRRPSPRMLRPLRSSDDRTERAITTEPRAPTNELAAGHLAEADIVVVAASEPATPRRPH
jgi:hypothetical protein